MCGFVPRRDVVIDDVEQPDEAAKYVGSWYLYSGSEIGYFYLRLDADGRFYCSDDDGAQPYGGTWCVVRNPMAGEDNLWISTESILALNYSDSMTMRVGVGLYRVHNGGGWRRAHPAAGESRLRGGRMHLRPLWRGGQIRQLGGNGGRKRAPNDAADSIMQRSCER